jgi:hypothetical protein
VGRIGVLEDATLGVVRIALLLVASLCLHCGDERRISSPRDAGASDSSVDASAVDAGRLDGSLDGGSSDAGRDAGAGSDAGVRDAGRDAGMDAGRATGLDPELDLPPAENEACETPGASCGGARVCRFYDESEGRCESCTECGNLFDPCASGDDCDILFVCFRGSCTNICLLGTFQCGAEEDCIDVGHPTHGACRPGF